MCVLADCNSGCSACGRHKCPVLFEGHLLLIRLAERVTMDIIERVAKGQRVHRRVTTMVHTPGTLLVVWINGNIGRIGWRWPIGVR